MGHWIFVTSNTDEEFERRLREKRWPLYEYTANRKRVRSNDKIVFYKAGLGNKKIHGTARAKSSSKDNPRTMEYYVELKDIHLFEIPALMKPMVDQLAFIENKAQWGRYMQGGVIKVSKEDFDVLTLNKK